MKQFLKYSSVAAAALICFNANAGTVDLFSTNQALLDDTTLSDGGLNSSVGAGDTTILGGNRDLYVELFDKPADSPSLGASIGVEGGALNFSVDTRAEGTGSVKWDGANTGTDIDFTGLDSFDLTDGGTVFGFRVDTLFSDGIFNFEIQAYTSATEFTIINFTATENAVPASSFIPFSGFTNSFLCGAINPAPGVNSITCGGLLGNQTVDFTNLGALVFVIDPLGSSTSIDLSLDSVTTVPEPATVGLVGAALLGLFATKRRRDAAKK